MNFQLENAKREDIGILKKYKLETILNYANELNKEEMVRINNYINSEIPKQLNNYKIIICENKKIGCLLVEDYEDGVLIDEIFLVPEYRMHGIGTKIINNIKKNNSIIYLWVYKENKKAIKLYKKLEFSIYKVTDTRFLMKYVYYPKVR